MYVCVGGGLFFSGVELRDTCSKANYPKKKKERFGKKKRLENSEKLRVRRLHFYSPKKKNTQVGWLPLLLLLFFYLLLKLTYSRRNRPYFVSISTRIKKKSTYL